MSYSPNLGRWLTEDPIEFEGGDPNLYRYEANNPTNLLDPSGLQINPAVSVPSPGNRYNRAMEQVIRDPCHKSNFLIAGGGALAYGTLLAGPSILRALPFWEPPVATQQDRIRENIRRLEQSIRQVQGSIRWYLDQIEGSRGLPGGVPEFLNRRLGELQAELTRYNEQLELLRQQLQGR